jgi:hypothetical protein
MMINVIMTNCLALVVCLERRFSLLQTLKTTGFRFGAGNSVHTARRFVKEARHFQMPLLRSSMDLMW